MKRNLFKKGTIMLLSFLTSCTSVIDEMTSEGDGEIQKVTICLSDSDISVNSRMNIAVSGSVKYYWENTDTIGIFPDDGYQVAFPLKTSGESSSATFTGGGWALKSSSTYAAYYPFEYNYRRSDSIPVSYLGQKQIGNKSSALADKYNYMSAVGNKPAEGSLNFDMKRLGRFIILKFNLAEPTTLTSVKLIASESVFTTKGYFNLWANTHSIIPLEKSNSLTIDLEDVETTVANEEVTIYFFMPPVNLSGENLTLEVTDENTNKLQYSVPGKDMTESKAYALNATIKESSVGNGTYQNGVVSIAEAGTMKKLLGKDYLNITSLKVVGPINGDDVYYLRKMLGGNDFSEADWGELTTLDLSEATIVEGGNWYSSQYNPYNYNEILYYYTSDDVIGLYMFYKCANLQNIILPNNITDIKYEAFAHCSSLVSVAIPNGEVGPYAFRSCDSLTAIVFGDGVTKIGEHAFYECNALVSLIVGDSVIDIGENAFTNCSSLTSVTIPSGIIGKNAFRGCEALKTVTLGDGVTRIGKLAFYLCPSLETVVIGSNVSFIGEKAFYQCTSINSVYITDLYAWLNIDFDSFGTQSGENPLCYGSKLYLNNHELTELIIPEGISVIQRDAFCGCESLVKIDFGKSVTKIDYYAFEGCTSLVSVIIPDNVTILNDAFVGCTSLTSVVIGDGVTKLGSFSGCSSLTSIIIGENVTELSGSCFYHVRELECYCYASTPPTLGTNIFYAPDFNSSASTLYVPERCGSAYKNSEWGYYFTNIIEMD